MSKPIPGNGRIVIDVPKDDDDKKDEEKNVKDNKGEIQITGETVKSGLDILEEVGLKGELEREAQKFDPDTPEEISKETELITERINKLDILITIGLYYTSLVMDWLTLLGKATSVQSFFFDLFLGSFNISKWDFGDLAVVAQISGMTTTLQTSLFFISGVINVGARLLNKPVPKIVGGPMYYGGPFQIIFALLPKAKDYTESIKSLDAKISQWLGFISQVVIIIAAIFAAANRVQALDPFIHGDSTLIGSGYTPKPHSEDQFGKVISPTNTTQVTLAVQNAALFARATYFVSVVAIIMTSLLNIIQWLADIWRVNKGDLLIYYMFKLITRALLCQPCLGDKWFDGFEKGKKSRLGRKSAKVGNVGSRGLSRSVPSSKFKKSSSKSPLRESMTFPSSEKFGEKSTSESSTSLPILSEKDDHHSSFLSPDQHSQKKLGRSRSLRRK
ncbi:hypothetical protein RclHR1_06020009 [Rhizophagus clarus]|uniref:Uncharacterized protein n=1 Tax=Rhizophagus clarus TaxID=94130 RepID=A0A2Z6RQZ8_9GLOM|nr:hypothetical protein RclHR1_06020009 [Rhizophagus clarus]GET04018.1 hypothetical protein GLOIN_2v1561367 [Rhizophagus clarus]